MNADPNRMQRKRDELTVAEIKKTRDELQSLFTRQVRSPHEEFVHRLEHTLSRMADQKKPLPSQNIHRQPFQASRRGGVPRLKITTVSTAISASLLLLIIIGTASVVLINNDQDDKSFSQLGATVDSASPVSTEPVRALGWEHPLHMTDLRQFGGMTLFDGVIYRLVATPGLSGVQAINALTGEEVWRKSLPWSDAGIAANADGVYYTFGPDRDGPSSLHALDPKTGDERWSVSASATIRTISTEDSQLFLLDTDDSLTAIDTTSGSRLWTGSARPDVTTSPKDGAGGVRTDIGIGEQFVSVVSTSGTIATFDRQTGAPLWTYADSLIDPLNYEFAVWNSENPLALNVPGTPSSLLLVITMDRSLRVSTEQGAGTLIAIDGDKGNVVWRQNVSTFARLDLTVSADTAVFAATGFIDDTAPFATPSLAARPAATPSTEQGPGGDATNTLFGLDVRTGELRWELPAPTSFFLEIGTNPTGTIIGSMNQGPIVMIDPRDAASTCIMIDGVDDRASFLPLVIDNLAIFMKFDGTLVALPFSEECQSNSP